MSYRISLLDKSPVAEGGTAAEALATSVAFAQTAERLGYHRIWLAEHHASPTLAGPAPEVLAAHLLAQTRRIRIGTGGILLQHYSPFKVAEIFGVLGSLAPGRVDLGIGKAPGGLPYGTRALQSEHASPRRDFETKIEELEHFLSDSLSEAHPLHGAVALPRPPQAPEKFLLGGSAESARLAARLGWNFTYAGHHDGDPAAVRRAFDIYAEASGGRRASLAVAAIVAPTRAEAEAQIPAHRFFKVSFPDGHSVNLPSEDAATEYARQLGSTEWKAEERHPSVVAGTGEEVHARLAALAREFGAEEIILDIPTSERSARLASLELLAGAALARAA